MAKYRTAECSRCGARRKLLDAAWMRARRIRAGLSLREVARRLKLSVGYLSDIETGRRDCPMLVARLYESL